MLAGVWIFMEDGWISETKGVTFGLLKWMMESGAAFDFLEFHHSGGSKVAPERHAGFDQDGQPRERVGPVCDVARVNGQRVVWWFPHADRVQGCTNV